MPPHDTAEQHTLFGRLAAQARDGSLGQPSANPERRFSFDGREIRVVLRDGDPWFVATDVCAALGVGNASDAAKRLDDDEKALDSIETLQGRQLALVVSESGLFGLILGSRKTGPDTQRFKRWVRKDVLPAIRRTGYYDNGNGARLEAAIARWDVPTTRSEALRLAADLAEQVERQAAQLEAQAPAVEAHARLLASGDTLCLRDAAKVLQVPERKLITWLLAEGRLYRTAGGELRAMASEVESGRLSHRGWTARSPSSDGTHRSGAQVRVTTAGLDWLARTYPRHMEEAQNAADD